MRNCCLISWARFNYCMSSMAIICFCQNNAPDDVLCMPYVQTTTSTSTIMFLIFSYFYIVVFTPCSPSPPRLPPKVGTPRWGLQVYDGALETEPMSTFLEAAGTAEASQNTPLTRLPTVMTRKEPKVKPPPPPPSSPRPEAETAAGAVGEAGSDGAGKYDGMNRDEILEQFRAKQAEREAARRKTMDEEVREVSCLLTRRASWATNIIRKTMCMSFRLSPVC